MTMKTLVFITAITHTFADSVESNLEDLNVTGAQKTESDDDTLKYMHGIIMFIAWAILCPTGIYFVGIKCKYLDKCENKDKERWTKCHIFAQFWVWPLTMCAFVLATHIVYDSGKLHFNDIHQIFGLILIIIATAHAFVAVCPPDASKRSIWQTFQI